MMRPSLRMVLTALALPIGSAIAWLMWAENEYTGGPQAPCPFRDLLGGPRLLLALGLSVASAVVMAWLLWRPDFRPEAVVLGVGVGAMAFAAIFVAAFFVVGRLGCFG